MGREEVRIGSHFIHVHRIKYPLSFLWFSSDLHVYFTPPLLFPGAQKDVVYYSWSVPITLKERDLRLGVFFDCFSTTLNTSTAKPSVMLTEPSVYLRGKVGLFVAISMLTM